MKKLFFLMPFALLAFASCSNDEVETKAVQKSADAVNFLPAMNNATRGTIFTDAGFTSTPGEFAVIASGSFKKGDKDNYASATAITSYEGTVKYESGAWTFDNSSTDYLWWADGTTTGKFTAYAPTDAGSVTSGSLSFSVEAAIAAQKDLVVAYNEGSRSDFTSGVPLHFRHALSQIIVNASYADEADETLYSKTTFPSLKVKIKAIKFNNLNGAGSLTLPTASTAAGESYTPVWAPTGSTTSYTSSDNEVTLSSAPQNLLKSSDGAMLLLPQTQSPAASLASTPSTGAYLEILADIDYATAFKPSGETYDLIDLYPSAQTDLTTNQTTGEGQYDWIAVPVTISWDGGYKYTYTLNFSNIACGKVSPNQTSTLATGKAKGDDVISGVPYPVNFLVTVEDTWQDGGTTTPTL